MRRLRGAAAVLWAGLLLLVGLHQALAVRFGAGLVRRANADAAVSEGTGGGRGRGAEFNAWTQRIKGEIATRWDQSVVQALNGSGRATERQKKRGKGGSGSMEEYSGSQTLRMLQFWSRAIVIYNDYKTSQVRRKKKGCDAQMDVTTDRGDDRFEPINGVRGVCRCASGSRRGWSVTPRSGSGSGRSGGKRCTSATATGCWICASRCAASI